MNDGSHPSPPASDRLDWCPRCNYSLAGTEHYVCPECGRVVATPHAVFRDYVLAVKPDCPECGTAIDAAHPTECQRCGSWLTLTVNINTDLPQLLPGQRLRGQAEGLVAYWLCVSLLPGALLAIGLAMGEPYLVRPSVLAVIGCVLACTAGVVYCLRVRKRIFARGGASGAQDNPMIRERLAINRVLACTVLVSVLLAFAYFSLLML